MWYRYAFNIHMLYWLMCAYIYCVYSGGALLLMSTSSTDIARIVSHRRQLLSGYKLHETTGKQIHLLYSYITVSLIVIDCSIYIIQCMDDIGLYG